MFFSFGIIPLDTSSASDASQSSIVYLCPSLAPPIAETKETKIIPKRVSLINYHKSCTKVIQKLYISCTKVIQKLYKSCTKVVQNIYKSCRKVIQKLYKSCTKDVQKLYKRCTKVVQKLHKS